jgi:hypothetical protein
LAGKPGVVTTRPPLFIPAQARLRLLAFERSGRRSMRVRILLVVTFAFAACPLQAQIWAPPGNGLPKSNGTPTAHVDTLQDAGRAIRQGRREGQLTQPEAKHLRREQRILGAIAERYAQDGLTPGEAADLDFRAHVLLDQVQATRSKH